MTTLYLAGPMTGYDDFNRPNFRRQERRLEDKGYLVKSPHHWSDTEATWARNVRTGLTQMLMYCDGVAMMEEWARSAGARVEVDVAGLAGMPVATVERWLDYADERK